MTVLPIYSFEPPVIPGYYYPGEIAGSWRNCIVGILFENRAMRAGEVK